MIQLPFNQRTLNNYELILTENCNFRCKYCFDDSFSDRTSCSYDYMMSVDPIFIEKLINFIEETKNLKETPQITFFGGEPLLNWNFIKEFIKQVEAKDLKYSYALNTNASLLDKEKIDYIAAKKITIAVSIDGTRESHDKTRQTQNGESTWNKVMAPLPMLLAKCRYAKVPTTALMVVDSQNFHNIKENYAFLCTLGFKEVNILWNFNIDFSDSDLAEIKDSLYEMFIVKRFPPYLDMKRRIWNENISQSPNYCVSPKTSITINPAGQLFFCHRLVPKMSELIKDPSFNYYFGDIENGFTNQQYLEDIVNRIDINCYQEKNSECKDCNAKSFCKGGCLGAIYNETQTYGNLESLCKIQKMLASVFLE